MKAGMEIAVNLELAFSFVYPVFRKIPKIFIPAWIQDDEKSGCDKGKGL
ncbi:MAG: hypothetical protein GY737_24175 [Desulfobacteraceae bacterium]|nr:hypothetical protein [Desulfobacteraceae bacterium]